MMSIPIFLVALGAALAAPQGQLPERRAVETGTPGERAPEVRDTLLGPEPVHQDAEGSCEQQLLALAGSPDGGFGAIWKDTRQGNLGLYLGLVNAQGKVKGSEVPIYPSLGTARQLQPDLCFTAGLAGMLTWRSGVAPLKPIQVRPFFPAPGFRSKPLGFGGAPEAAASDPNAPVGKADRGGRGKRGAAPRVVSLGEGRSFVAWSQAGEALAQRFDAEGQPDGEVVRLDANGPQVSGSVRMASDGAGKALVSWPTADGLRAWIGVPGSRAVRVEVGHGSLLDAEYDPQGGWWLLLQPAEGEALVRHLGPRGKRDRDDRTLPGRLVSEPSGRGRWTSIDMTVWAHGLVVAATSTRPKHPVRLLFMNAKGERDAREWHPLAHETAMNALVVSEGLAGERLLVAWTDSRGGDRDVFYSLLQLTEKQGLPNPTAAKRWNTDVGSGGQSQPALVSTGDRALIAWRDDRSGTPRLWMRGMTATPEQQGEEGVKAACAWDGDERLVPVGELGENGEHEPALALAPNGNVLVAWRRVRADGLRARVLDAHGEPLGPVRELGAVTRGYRIAASDAGYVLLAGAANGRLYVLALDEQGAPSGARHEVGGAGQQKVSDAQLVQLTDDRWLVTWDHRVGKRRVLGARLLSAMLEPQGAEIGFDYSGRGGDLQASAAPAPDGGFLLAWTAFDARARDVAAMLHDGTGKPLGRPLAVSPTYSEQDTASALRLANGDWLIVWEDDISYWDQIHARRVQADARRMGPTSTLNGMEKAFTMGRTGPVAAALGEGFVVAWVDRSRGLGGDVYVRVLGAGFDGN